MPRTKREIGQTGGGGGSNIQATRRAPEESLGTIERLYCCQSFLFTTILAAPPNDGDGNEWCSKETKTKRNRARCRCVCACMCVCKMCVCVCVWLCVQVCVSCRIWLLRAQLSLFGCWSAKTDFSCRNDVKWVCRPDRVWQREAWEVLWEGSSKSTVCACSTILLRCRCRRFINQNETQKESIFVFCVAFFSFPSHQKRVLVSPLRS